MEETTWSFHMNNNIHYFSSDVIVLQKAMITFCFSRMLEIVLELYQAAMHSQIQIDLFLSSTKMSLTEKPVATSGQVNPNQV